MKEQEDTTSYTLIWEVFSFTPIIDYSLLFRAYIPNKDSVRYDWTKLTIPAEYSIGILHSMVYTIKGLRENSIYEALVMSRNKYGWSKPSSILRFATKGTGNTFLNKLGVNWNINNIHFSDLDEEVTTFITVEPEVTDFITLDFSSNNVSFGNRINVNNIPLFSLLVFALSVSLITK